MNTHRFLLIGALLLHSSGCALRNRPLAEPAAASVQGRVLLAQQPLPGVRIRISGSDRSADSDENGAFHIGAITPGRHRLVLRYRGHEEILAIRLRPGEDVVLSNIHFRASSTGPSAPAPIAATTHPRAPPPRPAPEAAVRAAADVGVDTAAWREFLTTGKIPASLPRRVKPDELAAVAQAARKNLPPDEAAALLEAAAGVKPGEIREWWRKNARLLPAPRRDGSYSIQDLAAALTLLRQDLLARSAAGTAAARPRHEQTTGAEILLYDASAGAPPEEQNWWYLSDPLPGKSRETPGAKTVRLDTTAARADKAGYFSKEPVFGDLLAHPGLPVLDRHAGFTLRVDLRLERETHDRQDRSGCSLLVVCDDGKAIELGFWEDRVWAQADNGHPLFQDSRAEQASLAAAAAPVRYELTIRGSHYRLSAGGRQILRGALRDYTPFGRFPYTAPNLIFVGDDTASAASIFELARVSILAQPGGNDRPAPVASKPPEPPRAGEALPAGETAGARRLEAGMARSSSGETPASVRFTRENAPSQSSLVDP